MAILVHDWPRGGAILWMSLLAVAACGPEIPHPVSSTTDPYCNKCHVGRAGAPSGHKSGCTSCHEVTRRGEYPPLMPHRGGEEARCAFCHGGASDVPDAGVTKHIGESECYGCHEAAEYGPYPAAISHETDSQSDSSCLECHDDIDHRETPSCLGCHQS